MTNDQNITAKNISTHAEEENDDDFMKLAVSFTMFKIGKYSFH